MKKILAFSVIFILAFFMASNHAISRGFSAAGPITVQKVEPFAYFCLHQKGSFSQIQEVIGRLFQEMQYQNATPGGPPIGVFYNSPEEVASESLEWELGFPVTPHALIQPPLEKKVWEYTLVVSALHRGAYDKTGETITEMLEWMEANGYVQDGPVLERYFDQNPDEMREEDLRTEIWIPCKKAQ